MVIKCIRYCSGRLSLGILVLFLVSMSLPPHTEGGVPLGIEQSLADWRSDREQAPPYVPLLDPDDSDASEDGNEGRKRDDKIVGSSLLITGLFLCSWGISSWEMQEYQCCPARNTGNVVKIVGGLMLINAGLIYLLGAAD